MKTRRNRKSGQAMTEYIIIVVIVALAAIAIFSIFSDTLRGKVSGAVTELGGDEQAAKAATQESGQDYLKRLGTDNRGQ